MGHFCFRLADLELSEVIAEAKADQCNASLAMEEIVRRFDHLALKIAFGMSADPYLREELANSARLALVAAVRSHDITRAGFPTYAKKFMYGAALRAWKRSQSWGRGGASIAITVTDFTDPLSEALLPRIEANDASSPWGDGPTATAVAALSISQQELLHYRYIEDSSLAKIGLRCGTTVSAVRQRLETAHRAIERELVRA